LGKNDAQPSSVRQAIMPIPSMWVAITVSIVSRRTPHRPARWHGFLVERSVHPARRCVGRLRRVDRDALTRDSIHTAARPA
jgi:hypothetical protein